MAQRTSKEPKATRSAKRPLDGGDQMPGVSAPSTPPGTESRHHEEALLLIAHSRDKQQQLMQTLANSQLKGSQKPCQTQQTPQPSAIMRHLEMPRLQDPDNIDFNSLSDWSTRWSEFLLITGARMSLPVRRISEADRPS